MSSRRPKRHLPVWIVRANGSVVNQNTQGQSWNSWGQQRGQAKLSFEDVTERLKRLEAEIVELRHTLEQKRLQETQSRRRGDELRAELATYMGRRSSLEALFANTAIRLIRCATSSVRMQSARSTTPVDLRR